MTKEELIKSIVAKEWPMFHNVNGEDRVDCQENPQTFENMRSAQFKVWDEASLARYGIEPSALERMERFFRNPDRYRSTYWYYFMNETEDE